MNTLDFFPESSREIGEGLFPVHHEKYTHAAVYFKHWTVAPGSAFIRSKYILFRDMIGDPSQYLYARECIHGWKENQSPDHQLIEMTEDAFKISPIEQLSKQAAAHNMAEQKNNLESP